jgi:hypothetical protein
MQERAEAIEQREKDMVDLITLGTNANQEQLSKIQNISFTQIFSPRIL